MNQELSKYTDRDKKVWKYLYNFQYSNLQGKVCWEYLDCLNRLSTAINANEIPDFSKINTILKANTGWEIHIVPGLIPADEFFNHLKNKRFCSSTWLRSDEELHYIEEPDMFHDIFGHVPLLMNEDYANFAQKIGALASKWITDEQKIIQIQRLYWFTIEFGVIQREGITKSYGAGIISSIDEATIIAEKKRTFLPYSVSTIINKEYNIDTIQPLYYEIESFGQLYQSLDYLEEIFRNE
jgi:phenylalanine-4-hydroxylase